MAVKARYEESYFWETDEIIEAALVELGLKFTFLRERLNLPFSDIRELRSKGLKASHWIAMCDTLCLPTRSLVDGYSRNLHQARVRESLNLGTLTLPVTPQLQAIIPKVSSGRLGRLPISS